MVAWGQDRGRRSGTSLLTNKKRSSRPLGSRQALDRPHAARFPSEEPAPPNCLCGSISVLRLNNPHGARHKRNVVAYPNRTAVLAAILFLNLKLSSFSLQQLGDERRVGFAVVLMRYFQKRKCTQFLIRVTHHCLED